MPNFLHIDTKSKKKENFIVYNSKFQTSLKLKVDNNKAVIKSNFSNYVRSSAIEIRDFVFDRRIITLTFYYDNNNYFIDVSNHLDYFKSIEMFNLVFENYSVIDIPVEIINNLIKIPTFGALLNKNIFTCNIQVTKRYGLHVNNINKIHFLENIDYTSLQFHFVSLYNFDVEDTFTIFFIDKIIKPNTNLSTFSYDVLFRNPFREIKLTYISFPLINNISSNYLNNELIIDVNQKKYKIIVPNRYWDKIKLLYFIQNTFNNMEHDMNMDIQFDMYDHDYFQIYIVENEHRIPFKIRKSNLSVSLGIKTFDLQPYYYNTCPIDLKVILSIYIRLNNVHENHLLYLYDQENKNIINEISFPFTETIINNVSIFLKINDYIADFNNLDYNIILKLL